MCRQAHTAYVIAKVYFVLGQKMKYDDFDKLSSRIELVLVYNMYMQICKMIGFLGTAEFIDSGRQNL